MSRAKAVDEANCGVDDRLQWGECGVWQTGQQRIAVKSREDECSD